MPSALLTPPRRTGLAAQLVKALSVQNVLVTRPFSGRKSADVAALKQMIARALPELKDGDYEPAWNEITTLDGDVRWARFQGATASAGAGHK